MGMMKEFKQFAMRGNVVDMAVGIVIGGAFGKIVTSLVNDVIMPPVGMLLGNVDFSQLAITLVDGTADGDAVAIKYGVFVNTVLDFVVVAVCIFMVVKAMNRIKGPADEPQPPATKECPRCCSTVSLKATRCPSCTSDLATA